MNPSPYLLPITFEELPDGDASAERDSRPFGSPCCRISDNFRWRAREGGRDSDGSKAYVSSGGVDCLGIAGVVSDASNQRYKPVETVPLSAYKPGETVPLAGPSITLGSDKEQDSTNNQGEPSQFKDMENIQVPSTHQKEALQNQAIYFIAINREEESTPNRREEEEEENSPMEEKALEDDEVTSYLASSDSNHRRNSCQQDSSSSQDLPHAKLFEPGSPTQYANEQPQQQWIPYIEAFPIRSYDPKAFQHENYVESSAKMVHPMENVLQLIQNMPEYRTPRIMKSKFEYRNKDLFCKYHCEVGHDTEDCRALQNLINKLLMEGKLISSDTS